MDGELVELASNVRIKLEPKQKHTIEVVVDRLVIDEKIRVRLSDSVETALKWGEGTLLVLHQAPEREAGCRASRCDATIPPTPSGPRRSIRTASTARPPARATSR